MNAQFKKGALELCVLSQLALRDQYGYELTENISKEMKLAAAEAIAGLVPEEDRSDVNILPEAFDPRVAETVSAAVKKFIE